MAGTEDYGEWKDVPGYENELQVSSKGWVKQIRIVGGYWWPPKLPEQNALGYRIVVHRRKHLRVHVLVTKTFIGDPPSSAHTTVDHIDRDRGNNNVDNLKWATRSDQVMNQNPHRERPVPEQQIPGEVFRSFDAHRAISDLGRIRDSRGGGKTFTPRPSEYNGKSEYAKTHIEKKPKLVHHLVAEKFPDIVGVRPSEKHTIDHIDRNTSNNCAVNLRWATMSEQRLNQNRPAKLVRSQVQMNDQIAIEVRAPDGDWIRYASYLDATRAIVPILGDTFTQNQIGQIVRKYPDGYVATKGLTKGWSFRIAGRIGVIQSPIQKQRSQKKVQLEVLPVGESEWIAFGSCLEASRGIKERYGVKINQGSLSRFVAEHPEGHTITTKQNAGWMIRKKL